MWTIIKTIKPLTIIFWMTLHATSALAATLIPLGKTTLLTPETTTALKHLQTTAALYYNQLATETIRKHAYQPTSLWEAHIQETIDLTLALAQQPQLVLLTVYLAAITTIIRYTLVLYLLRVETTPPPHTAAYQRATQVAALLAPASTQPPKPKTFFQYLRRFSGFLVHLVLK